MEEVGSFGLNVEYPPVYTTELALTIFFESVTVKVQSPAVPFCQVVWWRGPHSPTSRWTPRRE